MRIAPEEKVRQMWLHHMIHTLHFPKELIVVEKSLKELPHLSHLPVPKRRLDILCYAKEIHPEHALYPLLIIECKKGKLEANAIDQVVGYNAFVQAPFIAVAGKEEICFGYCKNKEYVFRGDLPSYQELVKWVKQS